MIKLDLPDGWYKLPGDGLPGDINRRISGWPYDARANTRYYHFVYVKSGMPIYLNGHRENQNLYAFSDPPPGTSSPNEYMVASEKMWLKSVLTIMLEKYRVIRDEWEKDLIVEV